jgi:hypothetical protein
MGSQRHRSGRYSVPPAGIEPATHGLGNRCGIESGNTQGICRANMRSTQPCAGAGARLGRPGAQRGKRVSSRRPGPGDHVRFHEATGRPVGRRSEGNRGR